MSERISLKIHGSRFEIELEDGFAQYFKEQSAELSFHEDNDIKDLLRAYVQKNYDMYCINSSVESIIDKIDIDVKDS